MNGIHDALSRVQGRHLIGLQWFQNNSGKEVTWTAMQNFSDAQVRIINQAKGIYKPAGMNYALSVRQTLGGPYADRPVTLRNDGSWQYAYLQEGGVSIEGRDREATNRGLVHCMNDGIPVGVIIQTKPKPGVVYSVLGLALVTDWQDGYFILEGLIADGDGPVAKRKTATQSRQAIEELHQFAADFDLPSVTDERERRIAEIVQRRGQAKFRRDLIDAYGGRCAVTGCDAVDALDAAHISPYQGVKSDHIQNGILLRADIHQLFDLGLLAVDAQLMTVVLSDRLKRTAYTDLHGRSLEMPLNPAHRPSPDALAAHRSWSKI